MIFVVASQSDSGIGLNNRLPWPRDEEDMVSLVLTGQGLFCTVDAAHQGARAAQYHCHGPADLRVLPAAGRPRGAGILVYADQAQVLSRSRPVMKKGSDFLVPSASALLARLAEHRNYEQVFVCGGAQVYEVPCCC